MHYKAIEELFFTWLMEQGEQSRLSQVLLNAQTQDSEVQNAQEQSAQEDLAGAQDAQGISNRPGSATDREDNEEWQGPPFGDALRAAEAIANDERISQVPSRRVEQVKEIISQREMFWRRARSETHRQILSNEQTTHSTSISLKCLVPYCACCCTRTASSRQTKRQQNQI